MNDIENLNELFEQISGEIPCHKNPTKGSLYAENLIICFLNSRATQASVRFEKTPYTLEELYGLCRRACQKKAFIKKVVVSKNNGRLLMRRL